MIDTLIQRHLSLRAGTLRADDRSVEAVVSSETPVPEWDDLRGEVIPRVLLVGGAKIPASRQIPLLDSHNRTGIENQVGSVRNLRVEAGQIIGLLVFSSTAEDAWQLVREGHLTDVSVGFAVTTQTYVEAGASRTISGRTYQGPTNVATSWIPRETSIVSIGADSAAKILRSLHRTRLASTHQPQANPHDLLAAVRRLTQRRPAEQSRQND